MCWSCENLYVVFRYDRGLDKYHRRGWANHTWKLYEWRIAALVSHRCSHSWVLNDVGVVESLRLNCQLVYGDSTSRRWGWSLCMVQSVSIAIGSGFRCCWRQWMIWTYWLLRLDDRCSSLCSPWLTRNVSMWPWSVDAIPNYVVFHGLIAADAGCRGCVISPGLFNPWLTGCVLLCRLLCHLLMVSARKAVMRRPKVISKDFLNLALRSAVE